MTQLQCFWVPRASLLCRPVLLFHLVRHCWTKLACPTWGLDLGSPQPTARSPFIFDTSMPVIVKHLSFGILSHCHLASEHVRGILPSMTGLYQIPGIGTHHRTRERGLKLSTAMPLELSGTIWGKRRRLHCPRGNLSCRVQSLPIKPGMWCRLL